MKKTIIILCAFLMLAIAGCSDNQPNATPTVAASHELPATPPAGTGADVSAAPTDTPPIASESPATTPASGGNDVSATPTDTPPALPESTINGVVSNYNIVRTSFDRNTNDIKIFYPQIDGLSDKAKQAKINGFIKSTVLVDVENEDDSSLSSLYRSIKIDYKLMWTSDSLLSIRFDVYYDQWEAVHPIRLVFAANIGMKTGDMINLPDIIDANSGFTQLFIDKAQLVYGQETFIYTIADIKDDYFNADILKKISFGEDADYYFTSTGMVFTVYTSHAIGDYALYSLNYSDIAEYIKETSRWEDIKQDFPPTDFQIMRDQCFKANLAGFGDAWFVSGFDKSSGSIIKNLKFCLTDNSGKVKCAFPDYKCSNLGYYAIKAVSFKDVNNDRAKDVIIIASLYNKSEVNLDEAKVYLGHDQEFVMDDALNSYISENLKNAKTVSDVQNAAKDYFSN